MHYKENLLDPISCISSSDLAYFDGIPNTITKVAIAKPKAGVFQVIYFSRCRCLPDI